MVYFHRIYSWISSDSWNFWFRKRDYSFLLGYIIFIVRRLSFVFFFLINSVGYQVFDLEILFLDIIFLILSLPGVIKTTCLPSLLEIQCNYRNRCLQNNLVSFIIPDTIMENHSTCNKNILFIAFFLLLSIQQLLT